jgi:putative peptide zinc metalloprotease protein
MGVGIYLIWPAFYTDATDNYRLSRLARLRTDLGGVYFHLIFALAILGLYFVTGQEYLLLLVLLVVLEVIGQFSPFARFDGYWVLADAIGVPDFFSQVGPFLRSIVSPRRWRGAKLPPLKPWAKRVFVAYAVVTIPLLTLFFILMVKNLPALVSMTWDALLYQRTAFVAARGDGDVLIIVGATLQALLLAVQLVGFGLIILGVARIAVKLVTAWAKSKPTARVAHRKQPSRQLVVAGEPGPPRPWEESVRGFHDAR